MTGHTLDDRDRQILALLQENSRRTNQDIADIVGLSPSSITSRIATLETGGYILGYNAILDPKKLGFDITAFATLKWTGRGQKSRRELLEAFVERTPWVLEANRTLDGAILKVCAASLDALKEVKFAICSGLRVQELDINIISHTIKAKAATPLQPIL